MTAGRLLPALVACLALLAAACGGDGVSLATYENQQAAYRVKYPEGWIIDENEPLQVVIQPEERNGQMLVGVYELDEALSLDQLADLALANTRDRMRSVEELGRETASLPGGQEARVLDLRYDNPADTGGPLRSRLLLTVVGRRVYQVEVALLDAEFDESFARGADEIVRSLTVEGP
ncbi:MAG TPA: hypothetical protein VIO14_00150 [Dehalococcoidia bacterium]